MRPWLPLALVLGTTWATLPEEAWAGSDPTGLTAPPYRLSAQNSVAGYRCQGEVEFRVTVSGLFLASLKPAHAVPMPYAWGQSVTGRSVGRIVSEFSFTPPAGFDVPWAATTGVYGGYFLEVFRGRFPAMPDPRRDHGVGRGGVRVRRRRDPAALHRGHLLLDLRGRRRPQRGLSPMALALESRPVRAGLGGFPAYGVLALLAEAAGPAFTIGAGLLPGVALLGAARLR